MLSFWAISNIYFITIFLFIDMDKLCNNVLKHIVFLFNFFLFLAGTTILAVGIYMKLHMNNYFDFIQSPYFNSSIIFIMCCKNPIDGCGLKLLSKSDDEVNTTIYTDGCLLKMESFITNNLVTIAGVGLGMAIYQLIGVFLSCILAARMRREFNYYI